MSEGRISQQAINSIKKLEHALAMVQKLPANEVERTYHWDAVLQQNKNATAQLIRSAIRDPNTRGLGHRFKNEQRADKILAYLLHSRNAAEHSEEHGDKHPNPYAVQEANLGGFVQLVGSGSVTFNDCTVNGIPASGRFSLENGGVNVSGLEQFPVFYQPTQIKLDKVFDQNGKEFVFPFELVEGNEYPEVFAARYALNWLNSCVDRL